MKDFNFASMGLNKNKKGTNQPELGDSEKIEKILWKNNNFILK